MALKGMQIFSKIGRKPGYPALVDNSMLCNYLFSILLKIVFKVLTAFKNTSMFSPGISFIFEMGEEPQNLYLLELQWLCPCFSSFYLGVSLHNPNFPQLW